MGSVRRTEDEGQSWKRECRPLASARIPKLASHCGTLFMRASESKEHYQFYDSSAVLDLKFL
jgi:hypothetical protein